MATLTIRNLPDELHLALKERATRNRRSLNQEVIAELAAVGTSESDGDRRVRVEREIREIGKLRSRAKGFLTMGEIDDAKRSGRA